MALNILYTTLTFESSINVILIMTVIVISITRNDKRYTFHFKLKKYIQNIYVFIITSIGVQFLIEIKITAQDASEA